MTLEGLQPPWACGASMMASIFLPNLRASSGPYPLTFSRSFPLRLFPWRKSTRGSLEVSLAALPSGT